MMQKNNYTVTPLKPEHVRQMAEIEKQCFSEPWSEDTIRDELDTPLSRYFVCCEGERVLGYIGTRILLDQCDITNIAVHPDARRLGIATLLLSELEQTVRPMGVTVLYLEVREGNTPARAFYEKSRFIPVGRRKNYYSLPTEDAILMTKSLEDE